MFQQLPRVGDKSRNVQALTGEVVFWTYLENPEWIQNFFFFGIDRSDAEAMEEMMEKIKNDMTQGCESSTSTRQYLYHSLDPPLIEIIVKLKTKMGRTDHTD